MARSTKVFNIPRLEFIFRLSVLSIEWDYKGEFVCKLYFDEHMLDQFEGDDSVEWVGSGKPRPLYQALPGDQSRIYATFYEQRCGQQSEKPFAWTEIEVWTLMSEDIPFMLPVTFQDQSSSGRMKIRMHPKKPCGDGSIDLNRVHEEPTLANLCQALKSLLRFELVDLRLCNLARFLLESLYLFMREHFDALAAQAWADGAKDHNRRLVDPMDLCGNPLEDLLIQLRSQLQFAGDYMCKVPHEVAMEPQLHVIVTQILDAAVRAVLLICRSADMYLACNYSILSILPSQDIGQFYKSHANLLSGRTRLVFWLNGIIAVPPTEMNELLDLLLDMALCEVREAEDWATQSYTMILASTRQLHAQMVFSRIKRRFQDTSSRDTGARDALRRLLVHICQEADLLPKFLLLTGKDVAYAAGVGTHEGARVGSTGEGSYAKVYEGRLTLKEEMALRPVAIKQLKFVDGSNKEDHRNKVRQIYLEVVQTWTLQHSKVISLIGVTHAFGGISLVVPWMENKTVQDCLSVMKKEKRAKTALVDMCDEWIVDVAEGLAYLHTEGVVHGDLRGSNILVDDKYQAVIADFGLSLFAHGHSKNYASRRTGNSGWAAPELLENEEGLSRRPTRESDIYAFGIVCVEIYLGRPPYMNDDGSMLFCRRVLEGARPQRPEVPMRRSEKQTGELMRDELWELVTKCWDGQKEARPTARQAYRKLYASR